MIKRTNISGLRTSDVTTLAVLTQDLVRKQLNALEPICLCDLLALSEVESLPLQMKRDLEGFQAQMIREFNDLPEGAVLADFLVELTELPAAKVPLCLRVAVVGRSEAALNHPKTSGPLTRLVEAFEAEEPELVDPSDKSQKVKVHQFDVPDSHKHPDERKKRRSGAAGALPTRDRSPRASKPKLPAKATRDPERGIWLRQQVLQRLGSYGSNGLKEAVLVAGCQRQAPWNDISKAEVTSVLRTLERDGTVKLSVGRWAMMGRW